MSLLGAILMVAVGWPVFAAVIWLLERLGLKLTWDEELPG